VVLLCRCGQEAADRWDLIAGDGVTYQHDVCGPCGERLQGEMTAMHEALADLLRQGLDERMARRVVEQRIERGELCPTVPWPKCTCEDG
jgi:hypothetical protein